MVANSALEKLSLAVGTQDDKSFAAIVTELKLQRYCIQLCHWICFVRCRRFCIRVCPPIFNHPWFTHVGDFDILGDFDPGTGLTNKAHGHGGPNYGFFGGLSLRGFCPKVLARIPGRADGVPVPVRARRSHDQHHGWIRF